MPWINVMKVPAGRVIATLDCLNKNKTRKGQFMTRNYRSAFWIPVKFMDAITKLCWLARSYAKLAVYVGI